MSDAEKKTNSTSAEKEKQPAQPLDESKQSNAKDDYYARMQKEHPERCLDGRYYETQEEYAKAVKEKEARIEQLKDAARQRISSREAAREKAASEINKALYGEGGGITQDQMRVVVGDIEMDAVIGNAKSVMERQHLLNPSDYEADVKKPNPGKVPHNEDPYPVDLKIEELESHKPDVKVHQITTHVHGEPAAKAALFVSDTAEKRLIHLENIVATLMRYIFRMGARVTVNCVYYWGQTPFEKYKCIRCMHDDRVSDGQMVQIDQCLACTRYEPVYGQVYEVMNDLGANVAAILDDNQMGYADMEEYVTLARTERYWTENEKAKFDLTKVLNRDSGDLDFKEAGWGEGVKMDWTPVPKEKQRCHINWRQSINDDGSQLKRLASWPQDEDEAGAAVTHAGQAQNKMKKNYDAMESNTKQELSGWIGRGKESRNVSDTAITDMKNGMIKKVRDAIGTQKVDSLVIACMHYLRNEDISSLVKNYADVYGSIGVDNPALIVAGMACGINAINGSASDGIPKLEDVGKKTDEKNGDSKDSASEKSSFPVLDPARKADWLWVEFAQALEVNAKRNGHNEDDVAFFCKVCYLYMSLQKYIRTSVYDTAEYAFPYTDEQIKAVDGVEYSGAFGEPRATHIHEGVDLATGSGNYIEIHAIHDGVVRGAGNAGDCWDCNSVDIDHGDGTYARYLHCNEVMVSLGQHVSKGDVIATTGGKNGAGAEAYPVHLHLEFGHGDVKSARSDTDALTLFNGLAGIPVGTLLNGE